MSQEITDNSWRAEIAAATRTFEAAGVPSPRNDAELLAAHVLGVGRSGVLTAGPLTPEQRAAFAALVERRAAREPLQHLTGVAWFRHVELAVGPGVFVPRPETELVAGAVIEELGRSGHDRPVVVDLCTGSGAIAAAVADEVPTARVHAVELSESAYAYAARNLAGIGVDLRLGDCADAFPDLDGTVDVVVSNPPYVPVGSVIRDPEVLEHDPAAALWGGADGLDLVRVVADVAARLLRPGGLVVIEHADVQGAAVPGVLREHPAGWTEVADHRDLAGRDRWSTARLERAGRRQP
jgi:release factor glutamine methyltransferase